MTGVNSDEKRAVRGEKVRAGDYRGDGRFVLCRYAFVAAGKITEVEHPDAYRLFHIIFDVCVRVQNERYVFRAVFRKKAGGTVERLLLNIKCVDFSVRADILREPESVMPVAHSKVDGCPAAHDVRQNERFSISSRSII